MPTAPQNKGQGQAGGSIHSPANIPAASGGVMHGKPIADAPVVNGAQMPYPPVKEVKLGNVNDQEF